MTLTLPPVQLPPTWTAPPALLAISHGTSSSEGQDAVRSLVDAVAEAVPGITVQGGFVDVQQPDVAATLGLLAPRAGAVIVPLLLSAGYHVHVDLRNELRAVPERATTLATALGPDDRLVSVLVQRLIEAGLQDSDRVVLACAGSSDKRAVADCHEMGRRLSRRLARDVDVAFISAAHPRLPDAVDAALASGAETRVVVSTYLLAPGYFNDLAHATGAAVTTDPLLLQDAVPPAELVDLVRERYLSAVSRTRN